MLRRLCLRDVVLVDRLELALEAGFTVLTGETGAGKSILIEALQFALGNRADATLVRQGTARAEVSAEFDLPVGLAAWLQEAGFERNEDTLLLRRTVDTQGRSRAWINGSAATVAQLRELSEHLVDIHGQHAWQGLTRAATVRALLDAQAGVDAARLAAGWQAWRAALDALAAARSERDVRERERERLAWQIGEVDKLAPGAHEWDELNAEHQRLAHGQALLDGARAAFDAVAAGGEDGSADALLDRALHALDAVERFDPEIAAVADVLRAVQAQLQDAAHSLQSYLGQREPDPERLGELDARLAAWLALARRYRRTPVELPALLAAWRQELQALDAAADLEALERTVQVTAAAWREAARTASAARAVAAPRLAAAVTQLMQALGMAGGRFEVALVPLAEAQSFGLETVELRVAAHAGSAPRALAKVASGGELSRLALAVAVATSRSGGHAGAVPTLIFDEIDSGVGGTVADSVGALMKQLGRSSQVLAVTHLAQVAACADQHLRVSKTRAAPGQEKGQERGQEQGQEQGTISAVHAVAGEARVAEVARMLGGESLSGTAHAQAMLAQGAQGAPWAQGTQGRRSVND